MSIISILEGLSDSRYLEEKAKSNKKVTCPRCNSSDIDEWEKGVYYCNRCGHEFDNKDLEINEKI